MRGTGAAVEAAPVKSPSPARGARGRPEWVRIGVVVVLLVGVALRFIARPPLWLDEAQTLEIARRSLPHLFDALRRDGSPPLYYVLLHGWMSVFGTSTFALRAMSGVISVATLPLMWLVARRFGLTREAALGAVLLLATSPFAVRYASETRMYSLVLLLVLLALLAYERVWSTGGVAATAGAAVVTGALVLTQYWALFLVAFVGLVAVVIVVRRGEAAARAWRILVAMGVGCLAFVPWLPSFAYQSAHTGAPWGPPPSLEEPLRFVGGWAGPGLSKPPLDLAYYLLVVIAIAGYPGGGAGGITFRRPFRREPLLLLGLAVGTMTLGVLASKISASAYAARYSMIGLAPVLLVVAMGIVVLGTRARVAVLSVVCAFGLAGSAFVVTHLRTQAGQVAALLAAATPRDLVVFCPDQLGPAVHRLVPDAGRQVVYPTFGSPAMVDWVDYAKRNRGADPEAFAQAVLRRSAGHQIWLVYVTGYPTLAGGCTTVFNALTAARGAPTLDLIPHGASEKYAVAQFPR